MKKIAYTLLAFVMRASIRVKASKEKTQAYCLKNLEDTKSVILKIVGLFPERKHK